MVRERKAEEVRTGGSQRKSSVPHTASLCWKVFATMLATSGQASVTSKAEVYSAQKLRKKVQRVMDKSIPLSACSAYLD